jgi:acetyltransferase
MPASDLQPLFEPRGVVVVGASSNPDKLGYAMASSLATFDGSVQLVNSRATPGMHLSIHEAVSSTPSPVDLAIMCVPAPHTANALRDAAANGIRAALVCAGGFAEVGGAGLDFARDVGEVVGDTGIALLGPNTSGFFVPATSLFASFVPGVRDIASGSVAVVAASGGINHVLAFQLAESGVGMSVGVGIGAGGDISAPDVLRYLTTHEATRAVILHVETVPDGPALVAAIEALVETTPVVALVVGRNDVSAFAESHTGALATSWKTTRAALRQAGAVLVDTEEQAVSVATALSRSRARAGTDLGVGLITGQAGPGLIIADTLATAGVEVPRLGRATVDRLGELLPPLTFQENPVDTGRPSETFAGVLGAVASDPAIDVLGVYAITEPVVDLAGAVTAARLDQSVPVVLGVDGSVDDVRRSRASADLAGVALVRGPTRLAQAVAGVVEDARLRAERLADGRGTRGDIPFVDWDGAWDEVRGKELLDALGIATPPRRRCADRAAAHAAFSELSSPVAVKLVDATVIHKTELGGVVLGVDSRDALTIALDSLERVGATEFLVEEMAASGVDLVVGARVDPVFGPIVLLGLGGTTAEVLGDVSIRRAPLTAQTAARMLDDLVGRELLLGHRGGPVVDRDELARVIALVGGVVASGSIAELEINPLRVTGSGLVALDAVVQTQLQEGVDQ